MSKLRWTMVMALIGLCLSITPVWAAEYSQMTTEELSRLRATLYNASQEERAAFEKEWEKRVRQMTREEREKFDGPPANIPARDISAMQYGQGVPSVK